MKNQRIKFVAIIFLASVMSLGQPAVAGWNTQKLYTPDPIRVSPGMTVADTKALVKSAMLVLNWQIVEIGPNEIEGQYFDDGESALVTVRYDASGIRISYKDSKGLKYDNNTAEIHKTYNQWIQELEKLIRGQLTN